MYSAYAIANEFIRRAQAGRLPGLNSMKLQKLMYFAQAWHLQETGTPFFEDTFTRGKNGPVLNSIHHQVKCYCERPITQTIRILSGGDDREVWRVPEVQRYDATSLALVDAICEQFGHLSAQALSDLTHRPGSAWSQAEPDGSPISEAAIRDDVTV